MLLQKLLVDGFAAPKSLLDTMPEMDAGFAELPAQADVLILETGQEVDQSDIQVFDLRAEVFDLLECFFQCGGAGITACSKGEMAAGIDVRATGGANALRGLFEFPMGALGFGFMKQRVAQGTLDFRQEPFGLGQGEVARHSLQCKEFYFTAIVKPAWLCTPPIVTTTGNAAPAVNPVGTVTLSWIRPGTEPAGACAASTVAA